MTVNTNADYVRVSQVLERAFFQVPFSHFFNRLLNGIEVDTELTYEDHFKGKWEPRFKTLSDLGAVFVEAQDYAGVAVWLPPGTKKAPRKDGLPAEVLEYDSKVKQAHKKFGIDLEKSWFLHFLGRDPAKKEAKGAMSTVVVPLLSKAREENVPAVWEAITEHGRQVYEHWGFRVIDSFELIDPTSGDKYTVYVMVNDAKTER